MKTFRTLIAAAVAIAGAISLQAQTRMVAGGTSATNPPATPNNIAVIDSGAFSDEKTGIARVLNALKQLDIKFGPLRTEINGMRDRLNTMRGDIQKKQSVQAADTTRQQMDEADRLDLQIKRKAEDAQKDYERQSAAVLEPLQQDVGNALTAYAQSHGILLIVDVNRVPVVYAAEALDITKDFIADYNKTHPATGTAPAPAPAKPAPAKP